ncbi:MAG: winged helix-turn-helix domain-containing protein [Nitrososphaerota archaeon]|nr:winged helix-turn-helix domain-containing protein [Candidatus Calditenuaceae archaeon]MDW8073504.1 winged helix-turn-helix domain-containing protein [Nitrososphaerota archaeon]
MKPGRETRGAGGKEYRSRLRIYVDILESVSSQGAARVTMIMRDANLPYDRVVKYLDELVSRGLLERRDEGQPLYFLTVRGSKFLEEFRRFEALARAFGLKP